MEEVDNVREKLSNNNTEKSVEFNHGMYLRDFIMPLDYLERLEDGQEVYCTAVKEDYLVIQGEFIIYSYNNHDDSVFRDEILYVEFLGLILLGEQE
jgi:hypothetical protein